MGWQQAQGWGGREKTERQAGLSVCHPTAPSPPDRGAGGSISGEGDAQLDVCFVAIGSGAGEGSDEHAEMAEPGNQLSSLSARRLSP